MESSQGQLEVTSQVKHQPIKLVKKTSLHYVRSRDELLEEEKMHFENIRKKIVKARRTKIVGTISAMYCQLDQLRDMVLAGLNSFMVNMAFCTPDLLQTVREHRDTLENELDIQLPITCVLKGTLARIGPLIQPEVFLRKGQEYRIVLNNKVLGNNLFCAVDDKEMVKRVKIGSQILVDYGQISMTVKRIEKSDESIKILKEHHGYTADEFLETLAVKKRKMHPNLFGYMSDSSESFIRSGFNSEDESQHSFKPQHQQNQIFSSNSLNETPRPSHSPQTSVATTPSHVNSSQNRFAEKLRQGRQGKVKRSDVLVCEVDCDCLLKAFKPIFIYQKDHYSKKEKLKKYRRTLDDVNCNVIGEQLTEEEEEDELDNYGGEEVLTPKDIMDINLCLENDIDCICVSNVRSARDLKAVRNLIGNESGVMIMAKIQTPEAVENFEEIVKASDGVSIARGYLTIHMPVEKLFAKQKEMIHKCHEHLKPVLISSNVLDSMVSSLLPTMCEVGEISSLVTEYVDDIVLSSETSCGNNPIEAIKTLSRICVEAEALRIMKRMQDPAHAGSVTIKSSKNSIQSCVIYCALEAAYHINASIIVVFTTRGYTSLKLSKLRPPCPIIAVTSSKRVARNISQISAINSMIFSTLEGTEALTKLVLQKQKDLGLVRQGDFVVITSGDIENVANHTNNLKIIVVD